MCTFLSFIKQNMLETNHIIINGIRSLYSSFGIRFSHFINFRCYWFLMSLKFGFPNIGVESSIWVTGSFIFFMNEATDSL